jgi:hypothetical protein
VGVRRENPKEKRLKDLLHSLQSASKDDFGELPSQGTNILVTVSKEAILPKISMISTYNRLTS